ncbi:MAG: glycosyltransferase [Thermoguttaceae bacterium]|nr:glycosyltransferase [Thermoguttaceae bacterium]
MSNSVMAVLYLIPNLAPCGDSAQLELILRSLDQMGSDSGFDGEIHIFTFPPLAEWERIRFETGFRWLSVHIHLIRPYFLSDIFLQIFQHIRRFHIHPRAVHVWGDALTGVGLHISRLFKAQSIVSLRHIPSMCPPRKSTIRAFDYLLVNSAALQKYWEKAGYRGNWKIVRDQIADPEKNTAVHSSSEISFIHDGKNSLNEKISSETSCFPQNKSEFLAELGLPEDSILAVCAGPVEAWKRWQWAVWSIDSVVRIHPEMHLLFLDPELNVPRQQQPKRDLAREMERRGIARFVRQYERESIIHFIPRRHDISRILPFMDFFWNPQSVPGSGLALLEAAAAGIPIISADFNGLEELLPEGTCARVPVHHETTAIAAASHNLWEQTERKQEMKSKSYEILKNFFNSFDTMKIYLSFYLKWT